MKVIQVTHGRVNPDGDNGITRTVYNLHNLLDESFNSEIFSFDDRVKNKEEHIRECGTRVILFPRQKIGLDNEVRSYIKKNNSAIYHFHLMWMTDKNWLANEIIKNGGRYIITTHAAYTPDRIDSLKKIVAMKTVEVKYLQNASAIHALCYEEKTILRELGITAPIFVLPNGLSRREFEIIDNSYSLPSPYEKNNINISWVGRIRPDKNVLGMIKAIDLLPDKYKGKLKFHVIGSEVKDYHQLVKALVYDKKLNDTVILHGPKFGADKYKYILNSDIYLQPSYSEGISFSILDALACGVPSIISRQCNMNYYIDRRAFLVTEPHPEDIRDSIVKMLDDIELSQKVGLAGRDLIECELNWDVLVEKYEKKYRELINE